MKTVRLIEKFLRLLGGFVIAYVVLFYSCKQVAIYHTRSTGLLGYCFLGPYAFSYPRAETLPRYLFSPVIYVDVYVFGGLTPTNAPDVSILDH